MLIDTHAHLNFNAFRDDGGEVLKRTLENDIWVVMPGSQYSTSKRAVEIAEKWGEGPPATPEQAHACDGGRGVYAAVGLHPIHLGEQRKVDVMEVESLHDVRGKPQPWEEFKTRSEEFDYEAYRKLAQSNKTVAIGEIGLDYYYFPKSKAKREKIKEKQKEVLQKQMDLANELQLPVILHCRVAHDDLLEILEQRVKSPTFAKATAGRQEKKIRGVVHSYTGTVKQAERFMGLGLYFGFNGLILKNVPALPKPEDVISSIPLERIVLETDSPYLVPPQAGRDRNEPIFIKYIAEEIARIESVSFEEVAQQTTRNAKTLFTLPAG